MQTTCDSVGVHIQVYFSLSSLRTQTMWLQNVTLWQTTAHCWVSTKETSSSCRSWTGWRKVTHCDTCCEKCIPYLLQTPMIQACACASFGVSFRLQLWLCGQEEGGIFGGAEERHARLWWVSIKISIFFVIWNQICVLHIFAWGTQVLASWPTTKNKQDDNLKWQLTQSQTVSENYFSTQQMVMQFEKYSSMSFFRWHKGWNRITGEVTTHHTVQDILKRKCTCTYSDLFLLFF